MESYGRLHIVNSGPPLLPEQAHMSIYFRNTFHEHAHTHTHTDRKEEMEGEKKRKGEKENSAVDSLPCLFLPAFQVLPLDEQVGVCLSLSS